MLNLSTLPKIESALPIAKSAPKLIGAIIVISLATTGSAHAVNLIQNGSFENSASLGSANNIPLTPSSPPSDLPGWQVPLLLYPLPLQTIYP
jgi:hypothetical protein